MYLFKNVVTIVHKCCHIYMDLLIGSVWCHKFVNVFNIKCKNIYLYVIWFAIWNYFCHNICYMICEKEAPLKHLQKQFYMHTVTMHNIYIYRNCKFTKLSQIMQQIFWIVVPYCKSGHMYICMHILYSL